MMWHFDFKQALFLMTIDTLILLHLLAGPAGLRALHARRQSLFRQAFHGTGGSSFRRQPGSQVLLGWGRV